MQNKSKTNNILLLLAVAGLLSGLAVCFLGQHLNGKIYEYGTASSSHFQEAFGQISFSLLVTGAFIGIGSLLMLILVLQLNPTSSADSSQDIAKVLRDCGIENVDSNPLQTLQTTLSQLRLDLVEGKKRERSIIEKAVDVICVLDIHSRFLTVSKASLNAWGYNPQELEKTSLKDILVGDNSNSVLDSILGSANSIDKIIFECKLRRKDGRLIDVVWTAHWSASDGGLFCIVHDISERKYAERLLKNSENRLRRTLKGMPVGVLLLDSQGIVEFANSEASRMLHYASKEIVGASIDTFISAADKEERIQNDPQDASSEQQLKRFISNCIRKDGSSFPVDVSEGIIELGEEQKTIVVFIDKTAEKELERVKREFMAMVTHEIRTPISSVYGILALLEVGALGEMTERGKDLTRGVKATCKRVIGLITDLLDLEKMQAGKFALDCKQVSVRYAMEASYDTTTALADERKISIELPQSELCCWADEDRLVQVMVNLISNAIKYSNDGDVIKLNIEELDDQFIKISVSDTGRGIPEEKLDKIFDQFEQVEIEDGKKKGGTGLGLAICKSIVEEHGGQIGVTSKVGQGTTFWFSLPKQAEH